MNITIKKALLRYVKIGFFMIVLLLPFDMHTESMDLNFDVLFPMTWYQKGLASTMSVWHTVVQNLENDGKINQLPLPFDSILGKLAFGQFCLECMQKEEQTSAEDSAYFITVLSKLRSLLAMIVVSPIMRDRADCIIDMLLKMQKTLNQLHIPSDI